MSDLSLNEKDHQRIERHVNTVVLMSLMFCAVVAVISILAVYANRVGMQAEIKESITTQCIAQERENELN